LKAKSASISRWIDPLESRIEWVEMRAWDSSKPELLNPTQTVAFFEAPEKAKQGGTKCSAGKDFSSQRVDGLGPHD